MTQENDKTMHAIKVRLKVVQRVVDVLFWRKHIFILYSRFVVEPFELMLYKMLFDNFEEKVFRVFER